MCPKQPVVRQKFSFAIHHMQGDITLSSHFDSKKCASRKTHQNRTCEENTSLWREYVGKCILVALLHNKVHHFDT